ncbi:MAG: T9SS type A sorting domain-containing protein [Bacteroidetes bacterium]|nr:T9SS type A sorting domain-containing protein [Bacteroidota bacterium]
MKINLLPILSMAAAIFFSTNASAQRHIDWSVDEILVPPSEIRQTDFQQGSQFKLSFVLKNKGADTARVGDSVFYRIVVPISQSQAILIPGPTQNTYSVTVLSKELAPNDTLIIGGSYNINLFPSNSSMEVNVTVVSLLMNRGADSIAAEDNSTNANNALSENLNWYVWQGWGVGVHNVDAETNFTVYPNPSNSGIFHINSLLLNPNSSENQIKVFDIKGQLVYSTELSQNQSIDLSALNNGIYFVEFNNGLIKETTKVSITK